MYFIIVYIRPGCPNNCNYQGTCMNGVCKYRTYCICINVTGPAKIGHVGSQNLTTFVTHNFLLQYDMATQFSEIVHNLTGFPTLL